MLALLTKNVQGGTCECLPLAAWRSVTASTLSLLSPNRNAQGQEEDCRKRSLPGLLCAATPPAHTHTHTQEQIQENTKGRLMATGRTV